MRSESMRSESNPQVGRQIFPGDIVVTRKGVSRHPGGDQRIVTNSSAAVG